MIIFNPSTSGDHDSLLAQLRRIRAVNLGLMPHELPDEVLLGLAFQVWLEENPRAWGRISRPWGRD